MNEKRPKTRKSNNPLNFLHGEGEMVNLIREKDWDNTQMGPPEQWPKILQTTLGIILDTKFPMFIFWGDDLICFYNDAYRPSLGNDGKHPSILGKKGKDSWEEIWDTIFPLIDHVVKTGESHWSEDLLVPIYRNGKIEDVYWTFSYSAIRSENQKVEGVLVTCNETTEKVLNLKKLKESEDKLRFAIEAAELGSWDYDPVTETLTANHQLKQWLGFAQDELLDHDSVLERIIEADRERVRTKIQNTLDATLAESFDEQYTIENKLTGNQIIVRAKGKAWFEEEKPIRFNGILQDVTVQVQEHTRFLKQTNDILHKYIVQLQRSNAALQSFAYVSSHDLQEPLRKITIFISRIKERQLLGKDDTEDFTRMVKAAEQMRQLITDLLDYSRIDQPQSEKEEVDLAVLFQEARDDFADDLKKKNTTITVRALPKLKVIPYQFKQLFSNLICNATKFAKNDVPLQLTVTGANVGSIEPLIKELDPEKKYYKITFQDNGIGFPQEQSQRIFKVFQKLHDSADYEGTGIGLSIVKKIIDEHHGFVRAIGEDGKGATFEMFLPTT